MVVDLRRDSASYLKYFGVELFGGDFKGLLIPKGFVHGFITLEENSVSCFIVFRKFNFSCLFESYFLKVISVLMMIGISSFMLVVMDAFEFNNGRLPFIAVGFDIVVFSLILIFPIVFISRFLRSRGV